MIRFMSLGFFGMSFFLHLGALTVGSPRHPWVNIAMVLLSLGLFVRIYSRKS